MPDTPEPSTDASIAKERERLLASRRRLKKQTEFMRRLGWAVVGLSVLLLMGSLHLHKNLWILWAVLGPSIPLGIAATHILYNREWDIKCSLYQLRVQRSPGSLKAIDEFCLLSTEAQKIRDDILSSGRQIYEFDFYEMLEAAAKVLAEISPAAKAVRDNDVNRRIGMCMLVFGRMREAQLQEGAASA
jgi:hypothetical protein